jgi:hypothetical protein
MTECNTISEEKSSPQLNFPFVKSKKMTVDFEGGEITSDAGWVLLRRVDEREGLCEKISEAIVDRRNPFFIVHKMRDLIRQRVYQIAAGYEDCNDASDLRRDPLLKAAAGGREPDDVDLASQPTLCRLENGRDEWELEAVMKVFVELYTSRRSNPDYVILDIDPTDDPCHGNQQLSFFHGYYYEKIYHDLVIFDGETGELVMPVLRPGNVHGADGVVEVLEWLLPQIRRAWPETEIIIRADGGLAVPRLYEYLEREGCRYVIGLITNDRLRGQNEQAMRSAEMIFETTGKREQIFCEFDYQAGSWTHPRRVIGKAELLEKGRNQRFVVTNVSGTCPEAVYEFYRARGEGAENRIKEWKTMMHADRLSCHKFYANWFRLLLYSAAYALMWSLKQNLKGTELERSTVETIRLKIIKLGARIRSTARRIRIHCASGYPYKNIWIHLHAQLAPG